MNSEPSWDLYRTFLAALREASLSGAARRLGLTQPTVSRHIDALEEALDQALFVRTQRGLSPTDAALALRPYAETLASTSAALLRAVSGRPGEIAGTVRITASEVVGVEVLPPILVNLRAQHPRLDLEVVLSNAVDDLLRRDADVAIRMVEPTQDALVARRAGTIRVGLHAHRHYLERRGTPAAPAELAGHDLIGFDRERPELREVLGRYPGLERTRFGFRADSDLAQLAAIRAGFGIGVCQVPIARRDPDLVPVLQDWFALDLPAWIVMHEDMRSTPRCRAVFKALAAGLAAHAGSGQDPAQGMPDPGAA
ncbi:MAG TPA: LysR family transcriptional regulator [Azospirillaceae bacterium]|nr:LysR family transcriptional regulator [Azospirillaceae bacterium]